MKKPIKDPMLGSYYEDHYGSFRVMAISEGYAMCRRRNGSPFVLSVKEVNAAKHLPESRHVEQK